MTSDDVPVQDAPAGGAPVGGPGRMPGIAGGVVGHGSIRLIPENCTSCMICARECPTWCIHIDSHAEAVTDLAPGARNRTRNVLDAFDIDWALCMYCGICIDVCPFEALEWAGPHVAPAATPSGLVHGRDRLAGEEPR